MRSLSRRLEEIEASITSQRYVLTLEDGSTVYLERAADLHLMMAFIRAQGESYETGEPVAVVAHPHIELFARSVPRKGEGTTAASVRQWSRDYLRERQTT